MKNPPQAEFLKVQNLAHLHLDSAPPIPPSYIERYRQIMLQENGLQISYSDAYRQFADLAVFARTLAIQPDESW